MTYTVTYLDLATNSIMRKNSFKNIESAYEWAKENKKITPFKFSGALIISIIFKKIQRKLQKF